MIGIGRDGPCDCPPGRCAGGIENQADCINRLDGEVQTRPCLICNPDGGETWHHNGNCLRCLARAAGKIL